MTDTDVSVYDGLIPMISAEEDVRMGRIQTPQRLGAAIEAMTGSKKAGQEAEAKAVLAQAMQKKGY